MAEPRERRSLRADVLLMSGSKGGVMAFNLLGAVVVARELGPSGRGALAVAFTLILTCVMLGNAGLSNSSPYFVARDRSLLPRVTGAALVGAAVLGAALVVVGLGVHELFPSVLRGLDRGDVLIVVAGIPPALLLLFVQSVLLGEGRTVELNALELGNGALLFAAICAVLLGFDGGERAVLVAVSATYVVVAAVGVALALRGAPRPQLPDGALVRAMLAYGFRVYLATLLGFLLIRSDLFLVNSYKGPTDAGLYSVVTSIADAMFVLPMAVGMNLFPRVAGGSAFEMSAGVFRAFFWIFGALCLLSVPLAEPAITLAFGEDFAEAATLYYWIVPGIFCFGMLTVLSNHFAGRGYPWEAALVWVPGLALNVALNVLLLPGHGTWVASLASSVSYGLLLVLHLRLFARESGGYGVLAPRPAETWRMLRGALAR